MAYSALANLVDAVGEDLLVDFTDDANAGAVDEDKVTAAIESADALIDSYLVGRYVVPVDPVPDLVRDLSVDLAIVNLAKRRFSGEIPPAISDRRDMALRILDRIAAGKAVLPGAEVETDVTTSPAIRASVRTRLFGSDTLDQY